MARVKQAVSLVRTAIAKMQFREEYNTIIGMMDMAVWLNKMTFKERADLKEELEEKYITLEW